MTDTGGAVRSGAFERQISWAVSRETARIRSRRRAMIAGGVALGVILLQAVTIVALLPLRRVVPVAVMVDRTDGYTQRVDLAKPATITADEALQRSAVGQYVEARESVDPLTLRDDYRKVTLWSAGAARTRYVATIAAARAAGRDDRRAAQLRSVSLTGHHGAIVRFDLNHYDAAGRLTLREPRVATLTFRFTDAEMSAADRIDDPLGFQVTGYRSEAEAIPVTAAAPSPETPPIPPAAPGWSGPQGMEP